MAHTGGNLYDTGHTKAAELFTSLLADACDLDALEA
jgi:hypothetical protein